MKEVQLQEGAIERVQICSEYAQFALNNCNGIKATAIKISVIDFLCRFQQEFCLKKSTELFETIPLNYFLSPNNQTNKYIIFDLWAFSEFAKLISGLYGGILIYN